MDKRLLDILVCPVTRTPVRPLSASELEALNRAIAAGAIRNEAGASLSAAAAAGLVTRDGRTIYRIEDDIPVMLADEAIATSQIADFPGLERPAVGADCRLPYQTDVSAPRVA